MLPLNLTSPTSTCPSLLLLDPLLRPLLLIVFFRVVIFVQVG